MESKNCPTNGPWRCNQCGHLWRWSWTKRAKPERCKACGTRAWDKPKREGVEPLTPEEREEIWQTIQKFFGLDRSSAAKRGWKTRRRRKRDARKWSKRDGSALDDSGNQTRNS